MGAGPGRLPWKPTFSIHHHLVLLPAETHTPPSRVDLDLQPVLEDPPGESDSNERSDWPAGLRPFPSSSQLIGWRSCAHTGEPSARDVLWTS